jgi:Fur family transcriptional regulator, peroxide stress response regulator
MTRLREACREADIKLTPQRLEIFREVATNPSHPDAETVHRGVQRRMPTVSLDTVYRTLWLLTDLGLITTLGSRRESIRFESNLQPHHHFICIQCGLARDFESTDLDGLAIPEAVRQMGSVVATHVEVRGICRSCSAQHGSKGND